MDRVLADTRSRLQLLDARRDESVTRAIELSVQSGPEDLTGLGDDVDGIVTEMEALRQALEEEGHREDFPDLDATALGAGQTSAPIRGLPGDPTSAASSSAAGTSDRMTYPPGGPNDLP
jgi:hypothetical protein